jgi:hypothetical protein
VRRIRFEIAPWTGVEMAGSSSGQGFGGRGCEPGRPDRGRSPVLAEAFARLEVAWRLDDAEAAFRVLHELARTDEGAWLMPVLTAITVRQFSDHLRGIPRQADNDRHAG